MSVTTNDTYTAPEGVDGYNPVTVNVPAVVLEEKTIAENGIYTPTTSDGYSKVVANVPFYPRTDTPLELLTSVETMDMHTEPTIGTRYYPIVYLAAIHYPAATGEEYVNVGKYFAPTDANYSVTTYIDIIDKETGESVTGFPQRTNTGANFGINSGGYIRLKGWYVTVSSNHVKVSVITTRWNTTYSKPLDDTYATQTDLETWLSAYTTAPYVIKDDRWAVVDSGSCGDEHENAYYTLYGNGLLEIYGTGRVDSGDWDKSAVVTVDMSDTLADMHTKVFENHTALVSAKLPNEMRAVHSETFKGCTSLASIELSENVDHINSKAFQGCTSLASITIHATTPPTLHADALDGCTALTAIYVPYDSVDAYKTAWSSYASIIDNIEGIVQRGVCGEYRTSTNATYTLYNNGLLEIEGTGVAYNDPDGIYDVADLVYSAVIHEGITSIGTDDEDMSYTIFTNCSNLASVDLPDSLTMIGTDAFNSTAITSITIPNGVTYIGISAFAFTSLTTVDIPDTVAYICEGAFCNTPIETATIRNTVPPRIRKDMANIFEDCSELTAIYVPAGSVDAYKAAKNWSEYASLIQAIPSGG